MKTAELPVCSEKMKNAPFEKMARFFFHKGLWLLLTAVGKDRTILRGKPGADNHEAKGNEVGKVRNLPKNNQ